MNRTTLSLIMELKREIHTLDKMEKRLMFISSINYPAFKFTPDEIKILSRKITRKKNKIVELAEQIKQSEENKHDVFISNNSGDTIRNTN